MATDCGVSARLPSAACGQGASSRDGDKGRMSESERRHRVAGRRGKRMVGSGKSGGVFWGESQENDSDPQD